MCSRFVKDFADNVIDNVREYRQIKTEHKKILQHVNARFCRHPKCNKTELSTDYFHHNFWGDTLRGCGLCGKYYCTKDDKHDNVHLTWVPPQRGEGTRFNPSVPLNWDGGYICREHFVLFRRFSI